MNAVMTLEPEWERIDLLGATLVANRNGNDLPNDINERLYSLQNKIKMIRECPPWLNLATDCQLNSIDQDILACALAPEAEPRLGWMYQDLQPGITSTYPTPALIREMFFFNSNEAVSFNNRLNTGSPLIRNNLIKRDSSDIFQPIKPSPLACKALLGWSNHDSHSIPGAVQVPANGTWDNLVLPEYCFQGLREFMYWVTYRHKVVHDWRGRVSGGPVALFSGPSGTGKTFAAEVLANTFGCPLYRVDLGLLVSKYIGETEKNLNALFEAAHGRELMLLFDEADSLFGQRGDVKEARDRYANMEVSHLLSRIERHQGPCILTTNLRQNIDSAFGRRFQMVVEFPRPNAQARAKLWQLHLPPMAPCNSEVDFNLLGRELSLTGGQIRNAALHAAFLSAGESIEISLQHIARAVWTELIKEGGEMISSSLGLLSQYLPEEARHVAH